MPILRMFRSVRIMVDMMGLKSSGMGLFEGSERLYLVRTSETEILARLACGDRGVREFVLASW